MRPALILVDAPEEFPRRAAAEISRVIEKAVADHGVCTLALSGGRTPVPVYRELAATVFGWDLEPNAVEIFFADERCVLPDDPRSNYRMARETLFAACGIYPANIHRMQAERSDCDKAAAEYAEEMPEKLDLVILGMGADGHTASLFPGSGALDEKVHRVVPVSGGDPTLRRLTITPPVIETAGSVVVLISGGAKAETVRRAIEGPYDPKRLPIQLALGGMWILDRAAAAEIREDK